MKVELHPKDAEALRNLWAAAEVSLLSLRAHQANVDAVKHLEARLATLAELEATQKP